MLRSLENLSVTPKPKPSAFVYIVAKKGFKGDNRPHLLLMGHTGQLYRRWGVPGGERDASDSSDLFTAMREFAEELLGMHPSAKDVGDLMKKAKTIGVLSVLEQKPGYTAWMLKVDSALQFEMSFGLPKRSIEEKYNAALSGETKGYLWIPLPLVVNRKRPSDSLTFNAPVALGRGPLILRGGVLGPSRNIT
tara:strand:+ start:1191 stop:1766 length:576 start_codon:yes stop_codon:yes gene_type:complete